jgi:hypothetical protein
MAGCRCASLAADRGNGALQNVSGAADYGRLRHSCALDWSHRSLSAAQSLRSPFKCLRDSERAEAGPLCGREQCVEAIGKFVTSEIIILFTHVLRFLLFEMV